MITNNGDRHPTGNFGFKYMQMAFFGKAHTCDDYPYEHVIYAYNLHHMY